jgi:sugar phosphate isomerase/epimerase
VQPLEDLEIGLMFRPGSDALETVRGVKRFGLRCGQLGVPGTASLDVDAWKPALERERFTLVTVFAGYAGESYADIPTVRRTVGFVPPETRAAREARACAVCDFAAALGVTSFACHIGCLPEDPADPTYQEMRGVVCRIADHAAHHGQTFALETGQESARALLRFLQEVGRPNLRLNFDPANMVLYGSGDPIEALGLLSGYVATVHCKDGTWPAQGRPDALGQETPLGLGTVGIGLFVSRLQKAGYRGPLIIEREIKDGPQKQKDVESAICLLRSCGGYVPPTGRENSPCGK